MAPTFMSILSFILYKINSKILIKVHILSIYAGYITVYFVHIFANILYKYSTYMQVIVIIEVDII